jgi:hypothetical protein
MHILSDDYLKNTNSKIAAGICSGLQLNSPYLTKPPMQASITKKGQSLVPFSCFGKEDASQGQTFSLQPL